MLGEDEDNSSDGSFNSKSVWKRMAIVVAGPLLISYWLCVIGNYTW